MRGIAGQSYQDVEGTRYAFELPDPQAGCPDFDDLPDVLDICVNHSMVFRLDPDKVIFHPTCGKNGHLMILTKVLALTCQDNT